MKALTKIIKKNFYNCLNTVGFDKLTSGMEIPVCACQLGAQQSPKRAGNVWNPSAFTEKGKQASDQRQPGWLTDTGQTGGCGGGRVMHAREMRRTVLAAGRHRSFKGREPGIWDVRQRRFGQCFG